MKNLFCKLAEKTDMEFQYDVFKEDNIISIYKTDDSTFDIGITEFWNFIKREGLHEYCNDYYDGSLPDCHGQDAGKYSEDEYFDLSYQDIKKDLKEYILKSKYKKYF
jgi:hypothetical protein